MQSEKTISNNNGNIEISASDFNSMDHSSDNLTMKKENFPFISTLFCPLLSDHV